MNVHDTNEVNLTTLEILRRRVGRISVTAEPSSRDIRALADAVAVLLEMAMDERRGK